MGRQANLGFGSNEAAFNSWVIEQVKDHPTIFLKKTHGSAMTQNFPDLIGYDGERFLALENKYLNPPLRARGTTAAVGRGAKVDWTVGQRQFIADQLKRQHSGSRLGGLIAVLGTTTLPDIVIGVSRAWISSRSGFTFSKIQQFRQDAEADGKPFIRLGFLGRDDRYHSIDDFLRYA